MPLRATLTVLAFSLAIGAHAALLTGLSVVALSTDGNQELSLPLVAEGPTRGEGMLGITYQVGWTREGAAYRVMITRQDEGKYWRLAVQARFAPEVAALTLGYGDLPVRIPLAANKKVGQFYWFWENGRPDWLVGESSSGAEGLVPLTATHHGFFLIRNPDGSHLAQFALDSWKPGESVAWAWRVVRGTEAAGLCRPGNPAGQSRSGGQPGRIAGPTRGFIRVSATGTDFATPDGKPWRAMGRNQWVLPTLPVAEQERILRGMAASRMTVTRCGLMDCLYRPVPGVWNELALDRLRATLDRCAAHGLRVIVCLEMSACGYQYHNSIHLSPAWSDLYLLPEALAWYRDTIRRVVRPLRNHPAILAWDVTNEPAISPDPASLVQAEQFRQWLRQRYGTITALRDAWQAPDLTDFATIPLPDSASYEKQETVATRDFFNWGNGAVAEGLIARARLVRRADSNHLLTISHWNPRLLRGHAGAELFDFWAPHTYDLWANGPIVSDHVLLLQASLEHALPDRRRPVVIEEFGISEGPQFPEAMRVQHLREFRQAAGRWGLAGLMHWWEMTPAMAAVYAEAPTPPWQPPANAPRLAVYLPPSQEWKLMVYDVYMTRREWGQALTRATKQGYVPRLVGDRAEAQGCVRVLVLGDSLSTDETGFVRSLGLPIWALPGATKVKDMLPEAEELAGLD
jgi:hypothetical protein